METQTAYNIWGFTSLFLLVVWLRDMIRLHGHAWKEAGHRRWLWIIIALASFCVLLNIPVTLWYMVRVRPSIAAADADHIADRKRHKAADRADRQAAASSRRAAAAARPRSQSTGAASTGGGFTLPAKTQVKCSCSNGKLPCYPCGSRGFVQDSSTSQYHPCMSCGGSGGQRCSMCGGTGYRS